MSEVMNVSQQLRQQIERDWQAYRADPSQANLDKFIGSVMETGLFQQYATNIEALQAESPELAQLLRNSVQQITQAVQNGNTSLLQTVLDTQKSFLEQYVGGSIGVVSGMRSLVKMGQMICRFFGMEDSEIGQWLDNAEQQLDQEFAGLRDEMDDGMEGRTAIDRTEADAIAARGADLAVDAFTSGLSTINNVDEQIRNVANAGLGLNLEQRTPSAAGPAGGPAAAQGISINQFMAYAPGIEGPKRDALEAEVTAAARQNGNDVIDSQAEIRAITQSDAWDELSTEQKAAIAPHLVIS